LPIKPENEALYPPDWLDISARIRTRAGGCCEGSPGFFPDCRAKNYEPHPVTGSVVVLTVAHLNHDPADNRDENLRAMCQRCHNTYDQKHRQDNATKTRRAKKASGDLLDEA